MKFLEKVKDFFYEDPEDEDIELKPDKLKREKIVKEKPEKEKKEFFKREKDYEETQKIDIEYEEEKTNSDLSERELFRAERTFNFPVDMDDEEESNGFTEEEKDEFFGPTSRLKFDDEPVKKDTNEGPKTKFRPSPVISPVYGILDKDYNVEDVEEINKGDDHSLNKKITAYDTVRNKVYKEMDDELEKTLNERKSIFYNLDEKEETEDVTISYGEDEVEAKEVEIPETRVKKNKKIVEETEEADEKEVKADTNDLFNLLDNVTTDEYDDDDE